MPSPQASAAPETRLGAPTTADVILVGAGAAGLATAIFLARRSPGRSIVALDGARKIGAKILVAGGGRCNVTNRRVTADDFHGGSPHVIRRVLDEFPASAAAALFDQLGVPLHEEEDGKLFPNSNSARTVLAALLGEAERLGVTVLPGQRVLSVESGSNGFSIDTGSRMFSTRRVVLATGGQSLPKTGSDGFGYELARRFGHSIVPPVPALAPLVLGRGFHAELSGIAHDVGLLVRRPGQAPIELNGSMLWTHFGVSGPVAMNCSRHWERGRHVGQPVRITVRFLPTRDFSQAETQWIELSRSQPRMALATALAAWMPARVAAALLGEIRVSGQTQLAHLPRDARRRLVHTLLEYPLDVQRTRGFAYAEATAGGVALDEMDPRSMASRKQAGLYLVGEVLDVDGRIGGFNFQWAWSSAFVAAAGLARSFDQDG